MNASAASRWDFEIRLLAWLAVCVSVFSFLYYFRRGDVLLYGDAVAHINIARRVFDSKTPGLLQLGTVWLPLPHLVMIPFLISDKMWQTGAGGSIPSMVAYVFAVIGIFRLVRGALSRDGENDGPARFAAWTASAVFGLNPNLIYMQATAMGEALYLAFFIWALVYFAEIVRGEHTALIRCGWCLFAACLTRYDGWFFGVVIGLAVVVSHLRRNDGVLDGGQDRDLRGAGAPRDSRGRLFPHRHHLVSFVLIAAAGPALWLAYNGIVYRNPLEFENGPYSAKAIEKRTQSSGSPGHPGSGSVVTSGLYFLKSGEFNMAENAWLQRLWVLMGIVAGGIVVSDSWRRARGKAGAQAARDGGPLRSSAPLLLLGVPLPFYALSVAYGGVPIFIPAWWPFTHYNVRYGLQMLPAFAAAAGVLACWAARLQWWPRKLSTAGAVAVMLVALLGYVSVWRAGPICYREAETNMRGRTALEKQLANWLHALPPESTLLMYLGEHPGVVERAGIPLKRVINEGNHRTWVQPRDPEGLWERALADPGQHADYVLAFEGDEVWQAVQDRHFKELVEIKVSGQHRGVLYRVR